MTEKHGKRIAVINNEFGDTAGMEDAIVRSILGLLQFSSHGQGPFVLLWQVLEGADGTVFEECYQLSNGCICCSIKHGIALYVSMRLRRHTMPIGVGVGVFVCVCVCLQTW